MSKVRFGERFISSVVTLVLIILLPPFVILNNIREKRRLLEGFKTFCSISWEQKVDDVQRLLF